MLILILFFEKIILRLFVAHCTPKNTLMSFVTIYRVKYSNFSGLEWYYNFKKFKNVILGTFFAISFDFEDS